RFASPPAESSADCAIAVAAPAKATTTKPANFVTPNLHKNLRLLSQARIKNSPFQGSRRASAGVPAHVFLTAVLQHDLAASCQIAGRLNPLAAKARLAYKIPDWNCQPRAFTPCLLQK